MKPTVQSLEVKFESIAASLAKTPGVPALVKNAAAKYDRMTSEQKAGFQRATMKSTVSDAKWSASFKTWLNAALCGSKTPESMKMTPETLEQVWKNSATKGGGRRECASVEDVNTLEGLLDL